MDNQQAKVEEWEKGWVGGFTDGEGSIMLLQEQSKELVRIKWIPRISLSNCDIPTLNKLTDILDRWNLPYHISWRFPKQGNNSASWQVRVQGYKRVKRWLIAITPYLITKKDKAENMLDFVNLRVGRSPREDYSSKEMSMIIELRGMNRQLASTTTRRTR